MPEASTNHETELYTKEVSVRLASILCDRVGILVLCLIKA